jgi:hypothetical protein
MATAGTATAVLYFTNNGDTVRGHHVEFSCADTGYWLNKLIDNCQSNGRVLGKQIMMPGLKNGYVNGNFH